MKKFNNFLLICLLSGIQLSFAASGFGDYTYQDDRKFTQIEQLSGQIIVPSSYAEGMSTEEAVAAGAVKIKIASNIIEFEGVEGLKTFNIVAKNAVLNGYEYQLVDNRGSDFSKLKFVTSNERHLKFVHFLSSRYGQYTFFLPRKTQDQLQQEANYYSDKNKNKIYAYYNLVDKTITPYYRAVSHKGNDIKEKIVMQQGLKFKFFKDKLVVENNKITETFDIKKIKVEETNGKSKFGKKIGRVIKVTTKGKSKDKTFRFALNRENKIEFIQHGNTNYSLM